MASPRMSIKDRMAALQQASSSGDVGKPALAPRRSSAAGSAEPAFEPTGPVLHQGYLKKAGAGILASNFYNRWCVLHDDPALAYYHDESKAMAKGATALTKGAALETSGEMLQIAFPAKGSASSGFTQAASSVRLQATAPTEAQDWQRRIEAALQAKHGGQARPNGVLPEPVADPAKRQSQVNELEERVSRARGQSCAAAARTRARPPLCRTHPGRREAPARRAAV